MRHCRACGRPIEHHEVVAKKATLHPAGPIPGHNDRIYRCDVVVTDWLPAGQGRIMPVYTPRGAVRMED